MSDAGCINAYDCSGCLIRTLETLQSSNIGVGVQYCAPNPLDDKRLDYIKYTDKCGCTCCLSGENEILIYATDGVIKNFSLTNDDANEQVVVKWNDIFGTNWKKTVVRYSTTGFPASITDGTLAVEETTMNQYSTNGYGVTGLQDATTYYFTAFAVAQDDTIIIVQSDTVTTYFGVPKNGLLGYWKLQSDLLDYSGNGNNASRYGNGSFVALSGKTGARFLRNSSGVPTQYIITNLYKNTVPISIFGRGAFTETTNIQNWTGFFNSSPGAGQSGFLMGFRGADNDSIYLMIGTSGTGKVANRPTANTWYFYTITATENEVKFYINGELITTVSISTPTIYNGVFRLGVGSYDNNRYGGTNGYVRHFGIYDRIISDTEIQKIYNFTQ